MKKQSAKSRNVKRPRKLPNALTRWKSIHYDKAANAVMDVLGLTVHEWGDVRYAIRMALEGHLKS